MSRAAIAYIVPAYNAAATVAETVASVLAQSRADLECVVVDDGSTDETAAAARACGDSRVRLVSQENRGLAGARNRGLAECAGRAAAAVCFLDADDVIDPAHAERMLAALEGFDAAACAYRMVGPRLEDLGWTVRPGDHDLSTARLIEYNPLAVGAVVLRTESLRGLAGEEPFDTGLPVHEDWDCWLRLVAAGARWAPVVPEPLFSYRIQAGSMSSDLRTMHGVGQRVIGLAPVEPGLKPGAARRWTIRHVARAAARGDAGLAAEFLAALSVSAGAAPELAGDELELLAGSIRWALCQQHAVGPGRAGAEIWAAWRDRVAAALLGLPGAAAVLTRLEFRGDRWEAAARIAAEALRSGEAPRAAVYGLGRNGRDFLAALERVSLPVGARVGWIDDHPGAAAPVLNGRTLARWRVEDLGARDLVVVTPEQREGILALLRSRGITRVLLPDGVAAAAV
jgi:hypothetical protein